jgi:hypothetical protein
MTCHPAVRNVRLLMALVIGCLAVSVSPGVAQTAQLSGFVVDASDAVVEGALVVIANSETGQVREVRTNGDGQYVSAALSNGRYTVTVSAPGFATVTRAILLDVAQAARLDFRLKVGDVAETVTVSMEARPLQSTDGAVSTVIDRRFITALPLNGRTLQSLISLAPGVVTVPATFGSAGQFSVNGQRADANAFSVDGVSATVAATGGGFGEDYTGSHPTLSAAGTTSNLVSLDALQEFRIQTSSFAPEFGRTPGAQVQLITRSGANRLTGAGSYYVRHDAMDANDWFANRAALDKAKLRHHDVGGVFGGPLRRDRLFYFASHESLKQTLPQAVVGVVPSLAVRASAAETLRGMMNAFPLPNGPDLVNPSTGALTGLAQFTSNHSNTTDAHATGVRLDASLTSSWTVFSRVQYAPSASSRRRGASNWLDESEQDTWTVTSGLNATLSPRTALDVRGNFSRSTYTLVEEVDDWGGGGPIDRGYMFPSGADNTLADFILVLGGLRRFMLGPGQENQQRQINVVATASHVRGSHLVKAGVDYRRLTPQFDGATYQLQTIVRSLADLAAGRVGVFKSVRQQVRPVLENLSLFAQDAWSVNNRLTLTYGIRWDLNPPFRMLEGDYPLTLDASAPPGTLRLASPGTRLYETIYTNVAPRIGISLRLTERERWGTLLRGGGGLFFDTGSQGSNFIGYPNAISQSSGPFQTPLSASQVAPLPPVADRFAPPYRGLIDGYAAGFEMPRSWQWNVGIVQDIGSTQSVSLTYVGSAGRHLLRRQRLPSNAEFAGGVIVSHSDADSSYHGLSVQATRRMSRGFQALASWTWSHAIDETSALLSEYLESASSAFDVRQAGSVAVAYEIPTVTRTRVLRAALGGWSVDGIARWRTALPVDISSRLDLVDGEIVPVKPDRLAGAPLYVDDTSAPGGRRFNTEPSPTRAACLGAACAPIGTNGDFGRNVFRGFGAWQVDLALRRSTGVGAGARLTFSAEIFNLFNHPNFGQPDGDFTSPTYGSATSMLNRSLGGLDPLYQIGGPRSIQLGVRIAF